MGKFAIWGYLLRSHRRRAVTLASLFRELTLREMQLREVCMFCASTLLLQARQNKTKKTEKK